MPTSTSPQHTTKSQDLTISHTRPIARRKEDGAEHTPRSQTPSSPRVLPPAPFPRLPLPPELIHQIASEYYKTQAPLPITPSNLSLHLHQQTPLALALALSPASPLHSHATLPPALYYRHARFLFHSVSPMREFAARYARRERVRRVVVWYGAVGGRLRSTEGREDWVFSILDAFEALEELVFVVEAGLGGGTGCDVGVGEGPVRIWWECVKDAVREGVAARAGMAGRRSLRRGFIVSVECVDSEGLSERISREEVKLP